MLQIIIVILVNFSFSSELDKQNNSFTFGMANCVEPFNGNVYAASGNGYLGGLYVKEGKDWKIVQKTELLNNSIRDLINLDSFLIVATDKGVYSLDKYDNITESNTGLPLDISQNDKSRVLKMIKHKNQLFLTIDSKEIYFTDINKISWTKLNINYNKHIFDFVIFQENLFVSLLDIGLVKFNLINNNSEIVIELSNEIIYSLYTTDEILIGRTGFGNYYTSNSILWKNFNLEYNLNSNPILSLYSSGDSVYITDNTNFYYSYNNGSNWFTYNIFSQLKTSAFVHNIIRLDDKIYLSLTDFGVFNLDLNSLEKSNKNISNYKVNQIKTFSNISYYSISNLNYSYLYKIGNDIPELIFTLPNDIILDYSININNEIAILTKYNGLQYSKNGAFWEYYQMPNNLNYDNVKQKILLNNQGTYITNIDNENYSYFTSEKGNSWNKIDAFGNEEIINIFENESGIYAFSNSKIFRFNKSKIDWDIIYESNNIIDLIVDQSKHFIENNKIYKLEGNTPTLLPNSEGAERLISGSLALFNDNTLKYNSNDNWITIHKFQFLKNEDITDFNFINENHIQFGTKYLGLFDLYLEYLSVDNKDDDNLLQFQNSVYTSDQSFNLRIIDMNGLELYSIKNLTQYDIRNLENTKCLMIFDIDNNIIVKKHLLD